MAKRRTRGASVCLWQLRDAAFILDEMRLIKDKTEIARMRESARLTCLGHLAAMRAAGVRCEYHIESALFSEFKRGGGDNAFMPIIAAGANACTLHYIDNNAPVRRGQLVLADAGCQWRGYAADVSRVFPASGTFSPAQKAVYKVQPFLKHIGRTTPRHQNHQTGHNNGANRKDGITRIMRRFARFGFVRGQCGRYYKKTNLSPFLSASHRAFFGNGCA